jgi:hypothetical protein
MCQPAESTVKMSTSHVQEPTTSDVGVPRCPVCGSWGVEGKLSEPLQLNLIHLAMVCDNGCVTCALLLAGAMDYFQLHKLPAFRGGDFWVTADKGWSQVRFSTHRDKKPVPTDRRPHQTFVLEYTHAAGDGERPSSHQPLHKMFAGFPGYVESWS